MDWSDFSTKWQQLKGSAKQTEIYGRRSLRRWNGTQDPLIARLQEKYGVSKDEAKSQAYEWLRTHQDPAA